MNTGWFPLGAEASDDALYEDVPAWMRVPFWDWIQERTRLSGPDSYYPDYTRFQGFDSVTRRKNPITSVVMSGGIERLQRVLSDEDALQLADYCLATSDKTPWTDPHGDLELVLNAAGSAWRVGTRNGFTGLERRVPLGVQQAVETIAATPGHAGELLSEAWRAAFGRAPDAEKAYLKAVKAVEACAIPVVIPKDSAATLGRVVSQMRRDGDWAFPSDREDDRATPSAVVLGMVQALWTGHNDRHAGQADYSPTSQRTAEAAVLIAVPLVQWFTSGTLTRSPNLTASV
jgi:hypothetical protein